LTQPIDSYCSSDRHFWHADYDKAKTHIALGLGLVACQKGLAVGFITAAALVHELIEARDEKRLLRLQRQLAAHKLLIIDELGYVPLTHHVHILEMNGDSYRLKQSKRRQSQT